VENFLRTSLTNRPVAVEWHRAYQSLRKDQKRDQQLVATYEAMLQSEPTNSALLYLRGRLASDHDEGRRWFQRAREADPTNPYPLFALGCDRAAMGDWARARTLLWDAVKLRPQDRAFNNWLMLTRLALSEFPVLEQELRQQLQREPVNYLATMQLCDVLLAQDKTNEAQLAVSAFERAATRRYGESAHPAKNALHRQLLYAMGNFTELEKFAASDPSPDARESLFYALLAQGRVTEASRVLTSLPAAPFEPFRLLTVAVAWRHAGQSEEGDRWQERALDALAKGDEDQARAAALLRSSTPPKPADLDQIILPLGFKAVLLAALAQKHPAERAQLMAAARRFNVSRVIPYHFIRQVTAETR
jgi:hypothetical protein